MSTKAFTALATLVLCISSASAHDHAAMAEGSPPATLGVVSFETSCKAQVGESFNRGVALMHSFWHDEAEREFRRVLAADPDCAMAWWGVAMTHAHQILGTPTEADRAAGSEALSKADASRTKTAREAAYVHALHLLYEGFGADNAAYVAHAARYASAMGDIAAAYPDDLEATAFHGLALLAATPPDDVSLAYPKKAVSVLYGVFRTHPDHPGVAHYIIHACDNPQMAQEGLEAARHYALIAPAAPHALHMPGHIFARLGLWQEDIRSNLASKEAAERERGRAGAEALLHAMEFLEYAYLQVGQAKDASAIAGEAKKVKASEVDPRYAVYYPMVQARFTALLAIETQDWRAASRLAPIADAPWLSQQLTLLAHAMAAGHERDAQAGLRAAKAMDALIASQPQRPTGASATTVDEIHAWAAFSQGDLQGAVALLQPIAERQARTGKGEVELPAGEMLGEMLLLSGQFEPALRQFESSLAVDPNRFNGLLGAARAAEKLGRRELAARYYRLLVTNCPRANGASATLLAYARRFSRTGA
jgi:tetratricopeptide (TPR) repeat protein